jgi:beta-glucosidase
LSYTSFSYTLKDPPQSINTGDDLPVTVTVKNTGNTAGDAVLQIYIKDKDASVRVPNCQLAGFQRLNLKAGESRDVSLTVEARQLAVIREDGSCVLEPGAFTLSAGGIQPDEISRSLSTDNVVFHDFVMKGQEKIIPY